MPGRALLNKAMRVAKGARGSTPNRGGVSTMGGSPIKRTVHVLAAMVMAMLLLTAAGATTPTAAQEIAPKPNFVFILADDMRKDDLRYMPKTNALLGKQGMRFSNAFVSYALCCPSRATIMRGQYAHNTGVWNNGNGPNGGWEGYQNHGNEQDNVATRLNQAGYRTGLFGKYLNGYDHTTFEPPGWDDWFAKSSHNFYYDYNVNDNGDPRRFGSDPADYSTDVYGRQAREFIGTSVARDKRFFAYVAPSAPHGLATPARRHMHAFDGEPAPHLPSFNEKDVADKPAFIRSLRMLNDTQIGDIDKRHENRVETLKALDELVEGVVNKLQEERVLKNTYVVFTSDNGWYHGEHRVPLGKSLPYEEGIRVPLLIRGPGVEAGSTSERFTLNTDFLPTITDLAGIPTPEYVDGRSLRPLLKGNPVSTWRTAVLLERRSSGASFYGIRTSGQRKYIEYKDGFREFYDLNIHPYEVENTYDETTPPADLASRLKALKECAGPTCRRAENGP